MTRTKLLALCNAQRAQWFESDAGRSAIADMRRAILEEAQNEASRILADDGVWRASLQALGQNASLPIHDHPGTRGLLYVVAGGLLVHKFDVIQRSSGGRTAVLVNRGERKLGADECDWFGRYRNNLHSLQSNAPFTLVFSIRQCTGPARARSAFAFLTEEALNAQTGVAITKPVQSVAPV